MDRDRTRFPKIWRDTPPPPLPTAVPRASKKAAIDAPFPAVIIKSLEEMEASLIAIAETYATRPDLRAECRAQVIAAKNRARFASRNMKAAPEKRALKAEMVEWMLVWLGDPAMFATWAALRKRAAYCSSTDST